MFQLGNQQIIPPLRHSTGTKSQYSLFRKPLLQLKVNDQVAIDPVLDIIIHFYQLHPRVVCQM